MSHILSIFFSFVKLYIQNFYLNKFKQHHLCMYLYLCVWINVYSNNLHKFDVKIYLAKILQNFGAQFRWLRVILIF